MQEDWETWRCMTEEVKFWRKDLWRLIWAVIRNKSLSLSFEYLTYPETRSDTSTNFAEVKDE